MTKASTRQNRPVIRMGFGIRELLLNSLCRHPPEHYAVLAGHLSDPHRVTDCRPMPPMLGRDGRFNRGVTHVQLNAPFIEHYLNMEVLPAGKYILGVIHTHPGNNHLSGGEPGRGQGDIPSMRAALERAAVLQENWKDFLAPIITMDPETRTPTFTGWIVRLDRPNPIAADIVFEGATCEADLTTGTRFPLEEWIGPYRKLVKEVSTDRWSSAQHKRWMIRKIQECMRADVAASVQKHRATLRDTR